MSARQPASEPEWWAGGGVPVVVELVRADPARTALLALLLLAAGLAEAVGIGTLLPLLDTTLGAEAPGDTRLARAVTALLRGLGVEPGLGALLLLIVAALGCKAALRWAAMHRVGDAVARLAAEHRLRLIRALLAAEWQFFTTARSGHIANTLATDAHRAAYAVRHACAVLAAAVQVAAYVGLMLLISWPLALLALAAGGVMLLVLAGLVRAARAAGEARVHGSRALTARLLDVLHSIRAIKGMAREAGHARVLEAEAARLEAAERRQVRVSEALAALQEPLLAAMLAGGLYAAVRWGGQPVTALLVMALLLQRSAARLHQLQSEYQGLAASESAYRAVKAQVRAAEAAAERSGTQPWRRLERAVVLDGVSFSYGASVVLCDVSLRVPAGGLTLLVGASGAGKSTVLDLVLGLQRPVRGVVRVDGVPLDLIDLARWRAGIGYVPQESALLHDTVMANVTCGHASLAPVDVERALRAAGAWAFVSRLPAGMHTVVGEHGWQLSGGERRRIALARALAARPHLLVLDEPTAGVDMETAASIRETLLGLRGAVTILVATHDAGLEAVADAIYEIEAGRVTERATVRYAGQELTIRHGGEGL